MLQEKGYFFVVKVDPYARSLFRNYTCIFAIPSSNLFCPTPLDSPLRPYNFSSPLQLPSVHFSFLVWYTRVIVLRLCFHSMDGSIVWKEGLPAVTDCGISEKSTGHKINWTTCLTAWLDGIHMEIKWLKNYTSHSKGKKDSAKLSKRAAHLVDPRTKNRNNSSISATVKLSITLRFLRIRIKRRVSVRPRFHLQRWDHSRYSCTRAPSCLLRR